MNGADNYHLLKSMPPMFERAEQPRELTADRLGQLFVRALDLDKQNRQIIQAALDDLYERVSRLEISTFPNLAGDLRRLRQIIGDDSGPDFNPLDRLGPSR